MSVLNPIFPPMANIVRASAVAVVCVTLSGCVGNPFADAKVDPASPVAKDVTALTSAHAEFPKFASIPRKPDDLRPPARYGKEAASLELAAAQLIRDTAPETWTLQATDAFADTARRDAGPELAPPTAGDAEAFARSLRERATPPPPR